MSQQALIPSSAPFSGEEIAALNALVGRANPEQRAWLSGFLAGLAAQAPAPAVQPAAAARTRVPLLILYASESGNAEGLAFAARKLAPKLGFEPRVLDMADAKLSSLAAARHLLVYASTWGEGDPPQRAAEFYGALMGAEAPRLEGLRFAVLALGDSAYADFCATGRRIDARLAELGAIRSAERVDLDLDFQTAASTWTGGALEGLKPAERAASATVVRVDFQHGQEAHAETVLPFTAEHPLEAEIIERINLSGTGSTRETWHVELATEAAGFSYQPGDGIGVVAQNDPELVAALIDAAGCAGEPALVDHLREKADITTLSRRLAQGYAALTGRRDVAELAADAQAFAAFAADRQAIDLITAFPERLTAEQLKGLLRPLPPRIYSAASSPAAHEGATHLLVGAVRWSAHGRERRGVASTYIADRRQVGDRLKVYVKPNRHFRLPADATRPILMIAAGTGIAPYRAFLAERAATGAKGASWLLFGERNFSHDFLYQLEWQEHLAAGALTRLDVAFSRDQPEKIYVQHRLWQQREDVRSWIGDGAHVYVCGGEPMAREVDAMLARILGGSRRDPAAGRAAVQGLAKAGRYQRDVY
jgi:sulfite reductase (NADPH) flavoprotein alpha-component